MDLINDTIIASASAAVNQAVALIRISGPDAYQVVNQVFSKDIMKQKGYTLIKGDIFDLENNKLDEVILACFRGPKSFTGEDVIEINCHGGILLTQKIIKLFLSLGLRMAQRGEFSRRAFLNNKINLVQAEAINDLVFAENDYTLKSAINSLGATTTNLLNELSDKLLALIANINVNIDYPEYDGVESLTEKKVTTHVADFLTEIAVIKQHSKTYQSIKSGVNTAIIGKPNVGKSSLLNAFLNEDKAIVSEIQGTTRDLVEGKINLGDITLNLIDTAGIRDTADKIEQIGINKTKKALEQAQLIILVLDGSQNITSEDQELLGLIKNKNYIIAINKSDLGVKLKVNGVNISAKNQNINDLLTLIHQKIIKEEIDFSNELILSNTRQLAYLDEIEVNVKTVYEELKNGVFIDLAVVYLQKAWNLLLAIQGKDQQIDLIDEIFKRFCLGK